MSNLLTSPTGSFMGNDGAALGGLVLPFKPFTLDEVKRITGVSPAILDRWMPRFQVRRGSGAEGLDWMQTFAVFVGRKFLDEGAPTGRAESVLDYVAMLNLDFLNAEFKEGRTFPVPANQVDRQAQAGFGCLIQAPNTKLGNTLNLRTLIEEYEHNIAQAFPKG